MQYKYFSDGIIDRTMEYSTVGHDTIVNGLKYEPIYFEKAYMGLLREDTILRRVYFLCKDSAKEFLLYDFSLEKGDSIYLHILAGQYPDATGWYKVVSKDTVTTLNGEREVFWLNPTIFRRIDRIYTLRWIEGIGSLKTPLYSYPPISVENAEPGLGDTLTFLHCAFRDGTQIYKEDFPPEECTFIHFPTGIKKTQGLFGEKAYVSNSVCYISIPDEYEHSLSIQLYDILGRQYPTVGVLQTPDPGKTSFPMPAEKGIFILCFTDGKNVSTIKLPNY
jgi:hypothetical protein